MKIPLIDLAAQYQSIRDEIDASIRNVLQSGHFILGPNVSLCEDEIAEYLGAKYAIGVASGTDALILSLHALGIGQGDEVIVPVYTFFATAEAVSRVGATPVFVDINPTTYCLDVDQIEAKLTSRAKAIIPVHLYGHPADMDSLLELAGDRHLKIIEDNAQALGAEYRGRKTGSIGHIGCLSFFPSKNLGGYGDGGMVVTDDPKLAETVRKLRTHGWDKKYEPELIGYNSRLDELQAAVLRVKLSYLDIWNERRREIAKQYSSILNESPLRFPQEAYYGKHIYHLYVIQSAQRDFIHRYLAMSGIVSGIYYPRPLHLLAPYETLGYQVGSFPEAERSARETLAIPLYPEMTYDQIRMVVTAVKEAATLAEAES